MSEAIALVPANNPARQRAEALSWGMNQLPLQQLATQRPGQLRQMMRDAWRQAAQAGVLREIKVAAQAFGLADKGVLVWTVTRNGWRIVVELDQDAELYITANGQDVLDSRAKLKGNVLFAPAAWLVELIDEAGERAFEVERAQVGAADREALALANALKPRF